MDEFDVLFNQRVINEDRLTDAKATQAKRVVKYQIPKPLVNPLNEIAGDTRAVTYLGPATVTNSVDLGAEFRKGKYIPSLENMEEVFLNENFDTRDYFDSSLEVEQSLMEEMASPVVETQMNNSEIDPADLPEGTAPVMLGPIKMTKENMFKVGVGAVLAFLVLRGK